MDDLELKIKSLKLRGPSEKLAARMKDLFEAPPAPHRLRRFSWKQRRISLRAAIMAIAFIHVIGLVVGIAIGLHMSKPKGGSNEIAVTAPSQTLTITLPNIPGSPNPFDLTKVSPTILRIEEPITYHVREDI